MTKKRPYGELPVSLPGSVFIPQWDEFMHYLYLPIHMPEHEIPEGQTLGFRVPERLAFLRDAIDRACIDYVVALGGNLNDVYVYVTARRGFATPDNPINRPGWHCDGFGTDDINYVWFDRFPTLVAHQRFERISKSHITSARQFENQAWEGAIRELMEYTIYRFSPYVVHAAPCGSIPAHGAMRSFLKISISEHRYNLIGNSHNYLFDYDWPMHDRSDVRNDPHYAGGDYFDEH